MEGLTLVHTHQIPQRVIHLFTPGPEAGWLRMFRFWKICFHLKSSLFVLTEQINQWHRLLCVFQKKLKQDALQKIPNLLSHSGRGAGVSKEIKRHHALVFQDFVWHMVIRSSDLMCFMHFASSTTHRLALLGHGHWDPASTGAQRFEWAHSDSYSPYLWNRVQTWDRWENRGLWFWPGRMPKWRRWALRIWMSRGMGPSLGMLSRQLQSQMIGISIFLVRK